ncbi:MAG: M20/M25/M40 family metallo-hydrolase, partial [Firmicutes bacterium]|nr:M20/M25/M40 family metallo-hydrolase [Bacillota bacterium]
AKYEYRKTVLREALEMVRLKYPRAEIELELKDVYGNILDAMTDDNRQCVDLLLEALKEVGVEPKIKAMRGGTDGSFISTAGIPTPNYFTGALNFHSSAEFLPMDAFENALRVTLKLIELIAAR